MVIVSTAGMASRVRQVKRQQQQNKTNRVTFALNGTGEVSLPGAPSLHTHSSKFPIEREVIVKSSNEKQCKIPNLSDYMRRAKPSVAPDAPPKQVAWTQQINKNDGENATGLGHDMAAHQVYKAQPMSLMDNTKDSEPSPIRPANSQDIGPATSTPETDGARGLSQRTYQSLKEMISSRFSKQNANGVGPTPGSPNLDTSLSPQSQLRQHGVYIGTPQAQQQQSQQQQQQQIEMRGVTRSHQQQQRLYEQQQQRNQFQAHHQQVLGTPQMQYKYSHMPSGQPSNSNMGLPPTASYQPIGETPTSWKQYNGEGAIPKTQIVDNSLGTNGYSGMNGTNDPGVKSYSQDNMGMTNYNGGEPRYQSRPPSNQQQQYRGGTQSSGRNFTSTRPTGGTVYQSSPNQNDYHPHQTQFGQGSVIVHAPQDGNPDDNKPSQSSKAVEQLHREVPRASALAGPSVKEDDDEGGFVKRGAQSDSGRGSTVYSSAKTSAEDTTPPLAEPSEWSERVENELRHILNGPSGSAPPGGGVQGTGGGLTSATGPANGSSESFSSVSPPLPPLSPHSSDDTFRRPRLGGYANKGGSSTMWTARTKDKSSRSHKNSKKPNSLLCSGLEIDSMLDENNSSEEEDYTDNRAIRKQLEGLETMYGQVLKLLGVKKHGHGGLSRYEASDPRINKRRTCGSISSAPSSVSSRPIRATDRRGRAGKVRDVRGVNKRFQRLESHVVTLARSVAHLSSEMRTQHIMMQEMEMMRGELAALRVQTNMNQQAAHQVSMQAGNFFNATGTGLNTTKQNNSTPEKVKRLTKFFGDEPPLLRLFLRRLGYEKYASVFEKERIGLLELPFLTEERLHKLGIPLGPRLRIMQQAHLANPNTLCVL